MRAIGLCALASALVAGWLAGYACGQRGGEVAAEVALAAPRPSEPAPVAAARPVSARPAAPGPAPRPAPGAPAPAAGADDGSREALRAALRAGYLDGLEDEDPAVRADAAEWVGLDVETFPILADLLQSDPSPSVRRAAAEALAAAMNSPEQEEALDLLLAALHDPQPQVVLAALDSLEFVGDSAIIPQLGFLAEHADPEVRDEVRDTIGWLRD